MSSVLVDGGGYGGCVGAFGPFRADLPRLGCSLGSASPSSSRSAPGGSPAKLTRSTDAKRKGTCLLAWSRAANNNAPLSPCRRRAGSGDRVRPASRAAERCCDLPCRLRVEASTRGRGARTQESPGCSLAQACAARRARQGAVAAEGQLSSRCTCTVLWISCFDRTKVAVLVLIVHTPGCTAILSLLVHYYARRSSVLIVLCVQLCTFPFCEEEVTVQLQNVTSNTSPRSLSFAHLGTSIHVVAGDPYSYPHCPLLSGSHPTAQLAVGLRTTGASRSWLY